MSRVAAVDYGRRRIGLARTDALRITVTGLDTLFVEGDPKAAARAVAERLGRERIEHVVVGLPLHEGGEESEMSREVRVFADALGHALGVEVELVDEGLTSWEAEEGLKAKGARGKGLRDAQRRGEVDRAAAVALLRGWLRERGA